MTTLGVLADTHIPDRALQLNPQVVEIFRQAKVATILHAGDICLPGVLLELESVAPVQAVGGNRDLFYGKKLPMRLQLEVNGMSIGMAHGHGTFSEYMVDKIRRAVHGRMDQFYIRRMLQAFPGADVIIFGHLHVPYSIQLEGKLVLNPGSTTYPWPRDAPPTLGLLTIEEGKPARGEIITLD